MGLQTPTAVRAKETQGPLVTIAPRKEQGEKECGLGERKVSGPVGKEGSPGEGCSQRPQK